MDHCKHDCVGGGNGDLGTTRRQGQEDAGSQDEEEECGRQQIEVAHFVFSEEINVYLANIGRSSFTCRFLCD